MNEIVYSKIHPNEDIHNIQDALNLREIKFPNELSSLFTSDAYVKPLKDYYATLGEIIIIEPHSSRVSLESDYYIYASNIDKNAIKSFTKSIPKKGTVRVIAENFKRVLLEVLIKNEDDVIQKTKDYAIAVSKLIKTLQK